MKERDRAFHCEACRETIIFFAVTDAAPFIAAIAGTAQLPPDFNEVSDET